MSLSIAINNKVLIKMDEKESGNEEAIIEERKKKFVSFMKKSSIWALIILFIIVLLSINIRTQPMKDHGGGRPGLWDIATNTWTLGPDLDPFFFMRYAQIIVEKGSLPAVDIMRNAPLGFEPSQETRLLPYMIAWTYWIFHFSDKSINVEYAAVIFPVIMFALTVIVFFFFVREIFRKKDENDTKANIIALISTFFMAVMPELLPRTVAGIPEKESAAFFFMFLALYLFLKAWKSENKKAAITLAALSGISTAMMGLIWGGVSYVFVTIAISTLIAFVLNKIHKRETILYSLWAFFSMFIMTAASARFKVGELAKSMDTGLALLVFVILIVHLIVWNTKLSKLKIFEKMKLPKNIISLILAVILLIILSSLFFGAGFIIDKLTAINQMMFKPITGRWSQTVAENRQPFFGEWANSFGPVFRGIPIMFWLFFAGSVILFRKMLSQVGKKRALLLTALYVLFFFGLVFSRYSPSSQLNGENFISKAFYYLSALLLIGTFIYYYMKDHKEKKESSDFEKIDYNYILLFVLFVLCLFTARSAVRLIMLLAPIAPIFVSYLVVDSAGRFKTTKDETIKVIFAVVFSVVLILSIYSGWTFYKQIKAEAYGFVPSAYTQQWQKAMAWVRGNTPENAVFAHWWDYGYWVQTIGKRATVTDGGNFIVYWNYLTGRHVLTTDSEKDALEFLYNHNTTHLLIDSTDLGKYGAFAIIGSDENFDRYSPGPVTMLSDTKQSQKTRNGTMIVYQGGTYTDEDISFKDNENASEIFLPGGRAAIAGILLETYQDNNSTAFKQPTGVFIYQNTQYKIPLRYVYYNKQLIDYKSGLNATAYIIQRIIQSGQGIQLDNTGAVMYVSPRIMRGLLGQLYILNDAWKNFDNFEIAYSEPSPIVDMLNRQGANLNEFVFYEGIQGPIKIWDVRYNGDEKVNPAYLDTDYSKYISWKL